MADRTFTINLPPGLRAFSVEAALAGPVPDMIIAAWQDLARDHRDSGQYLAALERQQSLNYPYLGDPNVVAIVNTMPYAIYLEEGHPGFHLPSRWSHWKVSKEGRLYARVPFRIPTPFSPGGGVSSHRRRLGTAMPKSVYAQALQLRHGQRLTGFGELYKQSKSYIYYRQLFGEAAPELPDVAGYTWKTSQFEGMQHVTMVTPLGGHQAWYQTVRTITPESEGWYVPPSPAYHFADRALEQAAPGIQEALSQAAAQDAMAALYAALEPLT